MTSTQTPLATPADIVSWFTELNVKARENNGDIIDRIEPITLTIGKQTWNAVRFVQRGEQRIYAVGMLPKTKLTRNVCFTITGDDREWYVACYSGVITNRKQEVIPPTEPYNRFGNNFLLMPWPFTDNKIDTGAPHIYLREPMTITPA